MDLKNSKQDFEIFQRKINGRPLVYLDSAATSLKPRSVVEAMRKYYEEYTANVHRGIYRLSEEATEAYEGARGRIAKFIGGKTNEVVFTRNATEAINLVMYSWGRKNIRAGDEIVVSVMEHHANLVPWQQLAKETGAVVKFIELKEDGILDLESLRSLLGEKTKLVAISQVSNVLGTINPVKEVVEVVKGDAAFHQTHPTLSLSKERASPSFSKRGLGHASPEVTQAARGVKVLVDGSQAVPHMRVDVKELGCDWYVFSGHKMLGPTGIGVLWAASDAVLENGNIKKGVLEEMEPFMFGGDMIQEVRLEGATFKQAPYKFEAGTPAIAEAIGLGAAVDYLESLGMDNVREHEKELVEYALERLSGYQGIRILGPKDAEKRGGVISFVVEGVHPHDVAQVLDADNIYIRAGHHCAMPLHTYLGLAASCRASFYIYNTKEDVDRLVEGLKKAIKEFTI